MSASSRRPDSQSPFAWYLRRFQSMPAAEIPHRVREAFLRKMCRFGFVARRDQFVSRETLATRLPALPLNLDRNSNLISNSVRSRLAGDIDLLCAGNLTLLNHRWPDGAMCDWALDPGSGDHWRWQEYTFDIPRRHDQGPGDVKLVWELSRLQHLQVLALGSWLLAREDARERCLADLQAWLRDNPPYLGLGYVSGIELASRVISILAIISYLGADTIADQLKSEIWRALVCHGRWIARFPSLYSSANNHLVAESVALFVLGSLAHHLPEARDWKSVGWARLVDSAKQQILADGVGAEQSPSYLAYTMEWLLLSRTVLVSELGDVETELDDGLWRGAHFIANLADINGQVPAIGDSDESAVLRMGLDESNHPGSVVMAIARCLQSGELIHPAFSADLRGNLLTRRTPPESTFAFRNIVFPDGGYSVLRSSDGNDEIYLLFDHGPLGFAHTAAHGHADALSVWLHVNGRPVLIDFGTYRYSADAGWRCWARSTAAHNTIEINGRSQSLMSGPFNWGKRAVSSLIKKDPDGSSPSCIASHDGYVGTFDVAHEREVKLHGSVAIVSDSLSGRGRHSVKASFHFSPHIDLRPAGAAEFDIYCDNEQLGRITFDCPGLVCNLIRQEAVMAPGPGAVSPAYNVLQPAWSIVLSGQVEMPYSCRTIFSLACSV